MQLLLGVLLITGLLLHAIDIVMTPQRKIVTKTRLSTLATSLKSYSFSDVIFWCLQRFSHILEHNLGRHPFSSKGLYLIAMIHVVIFAALSFAILVISQVYERNIDPIDFLALYYSATFNFSSMFLVSLEELKTIDKRVVRDYFFVMKDVCTFVFMLLSFLVSIVLSYLSLGITRLMLRHLMVKQTVRRLASFVLIDSTIAVVLALCLPL